MHTYLARNSAGYDVPVGKFYLKGGVAQTLYYGAFRFDVIVFRHITSKLTVLTNFSEFFVGKIRRKLGFAQNFDVSDAFLLGVVEFAILPVAKKNEVFASRRDDSVNATFVVTFETFYYRTLFHAHTFFNKPHVLL